MKLVRFFLLSGLLLGAVPGSVAAGSFPAVSLQHLLRENDCEAVPELLGDWTTDGDLSGTWALQALKDGNYRLIEKVEGPDNSNRAAFDICVAHLGGHLFFDAIFQPMQPDGKNTLLREDDDFWIPIHLIGRLEIEDDALHFRLLDDNWLQEALKSGRVHLTCSRDDEGAYFLTAPSNELKQFVIQFASDSKAFSSAEDFARASGEATDQRKSHDESLKTPDHTGGVLREVSKRANTELEIRPKWAFHDRGCRSRLEL